MKDYRKYALWYGVGCLILPQISYAMTCEEAPDCTALGFKVAGSEVKSKCNGLSRMKCPFGDYYFCSEKKCELDYPYSSANCSDILGGSTCSDDSGTYYTECNTCNTSTYPYSSANCSGTLGGSTCTDSNGKHYSSCVTCDYTHTTSTGCSSYKTCSRDGRTYYNCTSCKDVYELNSKGGCIYQCGRYSFYGDKSKCANYDTCPYDSNEINCTKCVSGYYVLSTVSSTGYGTFYKTTCSSCSSKYNLSSPPTVATETCKYYSMCGGFYRCDKTACLAAEGGYGYGDSSNIYNLQQSYEVGSGRLAFSEGGMFMCEIEM